MVLDVSAGVADALVGDKNHYRRKGQTPRMDHKTDQQRKNHAH